MDPSNSSSSASSSGAFGYQTRLLERTSSTSRTATNLSRTRSQTSKTIFPQISGTAPVTTTATARTWTPSHRVSNSLDTVRGKWEERAKAESIDVERVTSPTRDSRQNPPESAPATDRRPNSPPFRVSDTPGVYRTPTYLKRQTMPSPIIASPLSPNNTGISVESGSSSASGHRIFIPPSSPFQATPKSGHASPSRYQRSYTVDPVTQNWTGSSNDSMPMSSEDNHSPSAPATPIRRRPTSLYGSSQTTPTPVTEKYGRRFTERRSVSPEKLPDVVVSAPQVNSVMSPAPYRSSYMSKKTSSYGPGLGVGKKLGNHLPRIASGDAPDDWHAEEPKQSRREQRQQRLRNNDIILASEKSSNGDSLSPGESPSPGVNDVAGVPGRLRLSRDKALNTPSPLPSSRLSRGALWADTQRHLIQAYEYLCHVGEAQQWIEGCLGEELEFGVVEMEECLRNGVVLAKLVRAFQGESVVRKIYEAPKLTFRHSDNINYFFNFVREMGLPEGFIFELTDLYEKKNLPKVIYCIHALSHLLARRGLAERIGNLLGQLKFSDDQLQATQKGLKDAGVAMPNFGNVGKELAKDLNEEPEVEIETDDERRDRLLLENEASIIAVQCVARGFLVRKAEITRRGRMRLAERHVPKLQALCRGVLARRQLVNHRKEKQSLTPWVVALQTTVRARNSRLKWLQHLAQIRSSVRFVIKVQAQLRGVLRRRRFAQLKAALKSSTVSITKIQTIARARITRNAHQQSAKTFAKPAISTAIVSLQAFSRGLLKRRNAQHQTQLLKRCEWNIVDFQAHCRGVLMRRRMRTQLAKLDDVSDVAVRIQTAVRTYLARKRLLSLIRSLRKATPMLVGLQARARANLARQKHTNINKALTEAKTIVAVGGFQALARAALTRNRHREQTREFEFVAPDVLGIQAAARGLLVREEYHAWRDHVRRNHPVATLLQAMLYGTMQRRAFRAKMAYYHANLAKVIKIQSLFRAKETREQYRQLTLGKNVTVGTIKNFVHLLDDSEADFQEEIKVERLRKKVVESIRENQTLETEVNNLDVMIALLVQNVKTAEEILASRRGHGPDSAAAYAALAAHGDPFAGPSTLDQSAKRKLESYQQLFYLLQTKGEYLSRLFLQISLRNTAEKDRRLTERVVLTLFGYGQDRREDYLLLKMFQLAIQEEISISGSINEVIHAHPMYVNVAVQYLRPKQLVYARESLQAIIREVIESTDLDMEADPTAIYNARIDAEEIVTGAKSPRPKDLPFHQALLDPPTRAEYIRHLQVLQWWTEAFITAITQSTKKMPYNIRFLARETLIHLRNKYPNAPEDLYAACIGRIVFYRYINPAIITPDTFDIVPSAVDLQHRKNLGQVSKVLAQIISGSEFSDDNPIYVPINEYVRKAIGQMSTWFLEVADVVDAETHFHAHEFLDAIVQSKPIYISPNEIYAMHSLLSQYQDQLAPAHDDTLRVILTELDGVPNFGSDELKNARDTCVTLDLTNRFAHVKDPHAEEKTLWVQAKRGVLAILRVQPAQDLVESLMRPVTEDDEFAWDSILENEIENEQSRNISRRQPSTTAAESSAYRLEDIRSLTFKEVKAHAIFFLLELEKQNKITRADGFQGILNAIAGDVRSKHRKRLQRQQEMDSMNGALRHLDERKKYFEEQIKTYHDYVESTKATMMGGKQGKKLRFVIPFTKQYYHLRDLQKTGQSPRFGSFKYTAKYLYEKHILLSVDQYSPRQFDKIHLTISSNAPGIFTLFLQTPSADTAEDVRMENLLQAKFENRSSLSFFKGLVKVNLNLFISQINKKFYS